MEELILVVLWKILEGSRCTDTTARVEVLSKKLEDGRRKKRKKEKEEEEGGGKIYVLMRTEGRKTDRRDAYELARRLRLGDLDTDALTWGDDGQPQNVKALLTKLATDEPALFRAKERRPGPADGGGGGGQPLAAGGDMNALLRRAAGRQ